MSSPASRRAAFLGAVVFGAALAVIGLRPGAPSDDREVAAALPETPVATSASPELAARAVDRLQIFRAGNAGRRLSLSSDEVTALLRHALPGVLPAGIADPVVVLEGGVVRVEARLSTADFVGRAPLAAVLGALPDTVTVDLLGRLTTEGDRLFFAVDEAHAGRVPLPAGAVAAIAAELSEQSDLRIASSEGKPSLSVRWPAGVALVAVVGDRLVLDRDERMVDRAVDGSDDP